MLMIEYNPVAAGIILIIRFGWRKNDFSRAKKFLAGMSFGLGQKIHVNVTNRGLNWHGFVFPAGTSYSWYNQLSSFHRKRRNKCSKEHLKMFGSRSIWHWKAINLNLETDVACCSLRGSLQFRPADDDIINDHWTVEQETRTGRAACCLAHYISAFFC